MLAWPPLDQRTLQQYRRSTDDGNGPLRFSYLTFGLQKVAEEEQSGHSSAVPFLC